MTDYSAYPAEPIVEGLVTFPGPAGSPPVFNGRGVSLITRAVGFPLGAYVLQLDEGLPGNAGAVPPGTNAISNPNVRTMIMQRVTVGAPPLPNIATIAVLYPVSLVPGVGSDRILVVMRTFPPAFADPTGGFEIIVWSVP